MATFGREGCINGTLFSIAWFAASLYAYIWCRRLIFFEITLLERVSILPRNSIRGDKNLEMARGRTLMFQPENTVISMSLMHQAPNDRTKPKLGSVVIAISRYFLISEWFPFLLSVPRLTFMWWQVINVFQADVCDLSVACKCTMQEF